MLVGDNGWVIYDRFSQLTHAFSSLFRKSALCCRVKFHEVPNLAAKGCGINEKLLKYWTCVKMPNLECYFMLFLLSSLCCAAWILLLSFRDVMDLCLLTFFFSGLSFCCCFSGRFHIADVLLNPFRFQIFFSIIDFLWL